MLFTALHPLLPNPLYDGLQVLKKGGRAKKKRTKRKVPAGDMVMLQKGMPPMASGVMGAGRLQSPGLLFGGAMPVPLQSTTYATAPQVAKPFSRVEFVGSSDSLYNRGRIRSDDYMVTVNPSDIVPDVTPSVRLIKSHNPNQITPQPTMVDLETQTSTPFIGKTTRLGLDAFKEAMRAMKSQPSTGFMNTQLPVKMSKTTYYDTNPMTSTTEIIEEGPSESMPEKGDDLPNAGRPAMSSREAMGRSLRETPQRNPGFKYSKARGGSVAKPAGVHYAVPSNVEWGNQGERKTVKEVNEKKAVAKALARGGGVFPFFAHHQDAKARGGGVFPFFAHHQD